jgi:hypothetical protein
MHTHCRTDITSRLCSNFIGFIRKTNEMGVDGPWVDSRSFGRHVMVRVTPSCEDITPPPWFIPLVKPPTFVFVLTVILLSSQMEILPCGCCCIK